MNFTETGSYTYNGEVVEYHYSPTATISEQIAFVEAVADGVFVSGNCVPLLKEPIFNYTLVNTFTDIDINDFARLDAFDEFDKQTGISKELAENIDYNIYNNLKNSVDANIEYKKTAAHDNISIAIVDLLNTARDRIAAFGKGLDVNAVMDFIQKFSESNIDGESIVKAYLDSDQYKENVADVVDTKNSEIRDLKQKLNEVTAKNVTADAHIKDNGTILDGVVPIKGNE